MKVFSKKRIVDYLPTTTWVYSVIMIILYLCSYIIPNYNENDVIKSIMFCVCCGFMSFEISKSSKKSFIVTIALTMSTSLYSNITNSTIGILVLFVMAVVFSVVVTKYDLLYGFIIMLLLSIVTGAVLGLIDKYIIEFLMFIINGIKGKYLLINRLIQPLSILFDSYNTEVLTSDVTGSALIDKKIVTGALNIFNKTRDNPALLTSSYLTNQYFENIILPIGIVLGMYKNMQKEHKLSFVFALALCIISGNNTVFSVFVLLYNPIIYFSFWVLGGLSNVICKLVDIRIGYAKSASLVELLCFIQKPIYFFAIGFVFVALTYFITRWIVENFNFTKGRYFPKEVRKIVKSLGGDENIENIKDGIVIVKNPNLIDIISLDCEIYSNKIVLIENDFEKLKKYY